VPADHRLAAYAMVVTAACCFVVNAAVSRVVLRAGVDPAGLTSLRVTGAVCVLAVWAAVLRPTALRPPRGRPLLLVVVLGVVGVAGLQWTYFVAIDRLTIGLALLLEYTAPLLVALYVRLVRRDEVHPRVWAALVLSLVGLALVAQVWKGLTVDGLGVLAGLGAAVCFATYFLLGESGVSEEDPVSVVLWSFLVAAVLMNIVDPLFTVDPDVLSETTSLLGALDALSAPVWALLVGIVLLGTVTPFALELFALQRLPAKVVVVVAMLEPVGVSALGWAWFGESLTPIQVVGSAAVVVGIVAAQLARPAAVPDHPPLPGLDVPPHR
jgi:drug/metabolite transporter (DMT)-like permease